MNPNLSDARPNAGHGFPVQWIQPLLNTPQFHARDASGIQREGTDVSPRRAEPVERLAGHATICKYSYTLSSLKGQDGQTAVGAKGRVLVTERL